MSRFLDSVSVAEGKVRNDADCGVNISPLLQLASDDATIGPTTSNSGRDYVMAVYLDS